MAPVLERVTESSADDLLQFLLTHDSVQPMADREALSRRLRNNGRGYVLMDRDRSSEPLSFIWAALTEVYPTSIGSLLHAASEADSDDPTRLAIFYSVHNVRPDLTSPEGRSWAKHVLIGAAAELRADRPSLRTVATLSPIPGYRRWESGEPTPANVLRYLRTPGADGRPMDPVARFHLGNGARIERLLPHADRSPLGLDRSFGWMVSYRYPDPEPDPTG